MKKIYITNKYSCDRRLLDAKKLVVYFKSNKYKIVNTPIKADYIIYVTCGFSQKRCDSTLDEIKKLRKYNKELIILGCIPATSPERLNNVFDGKRLATKDLNNIDQFFPDFKLKFSSIKDDDCIKINLNNDNPKDLFFREFSLTLRFAKKVYNYLIKNVNLFFREFSLTLRFAKKVYNYLIKNVKKIEEKYENNKNEVYCFRISHGCVDNCSYCAIKNATGKLKSKPLDECIEEYKKQLDNGYNVFTFNSEECGSYGIDIGTTFEKLLTQLDNLKQKNSVSWRIHNFNPYWALKYKNKTLDLIRKGRIEFIKVDCQSGSPRILRQMNRDYDPEEVKQLYAEYKKASPCIRILSHFIVGFPSETDQDFQKTLDINNVNLDRLDFYIYTDMVGTQSYDMKHKVPEKTIIKRLDMAKSILEKKGYVVKLAKEALYANKIA